MSKFSKKQIARNSDSDQVNLTSLHRLIQNIKADTATRPRNSLVDQAIAKTVVSMEGYKAEEVAVMEQSLKGLEVSLEGFLSGTEFSGKLTAAQQEAGVFAAALAGDAHGNRVFNIDTKSNRPALEGVTYIDPVGSDMFYEAPFKAALESFDESDNRHVTTYSTTYNMLASRQGPFAEMFFPTVTVAPDQVGFETTIRLNYVMSEVTSGIDGSVSVFNRKNLIQAAIDPDIFDSDQTQVVPVYTAAAAAKFMDTGLVAPRQVMVGEESVTTSPLKVNAKIGLLPISQTEALLATGTIDYSDALDTNIELDAVYIKLTATVAGNPVTEVFRFSARRLPTSVFAHALQGMERQMNLTFENDAFNFSSATLTAAGTASVILAALGTNTARLLLGIQGKVNLQTSETQVWVRPCETSLVRDVDGNVLPQDSGVGLTITTLLNTATVEGYDLYAHRVNSNQRQRGQLLDTVYYNQIYTVPLRSPLSIARPRGASEENDASDLASLITATHFKINNDAVKTLLEAVDMLNDYVTNVDNYDTAPAILGVARNLVTAYYRTQNIDLTQVVQSLTSVDRRDNIQQALVLVIRDHVFNAYRDSGWQPAADSLAGGDGGKPVILIGTDPVIAGYLTVNADTRLLGNDWDVQIESTWNKYMKGKIIISFGQRNSGGKHNPMHFGNMAYKSELALILPTHRNGQNSKELMVTPSYLHVVNLPIAIQLNITGLTEVATGQVAIPMHTV